MNLRTLVVAGCFLCLPAAGSGTLRAAEEQGFVSYNGLDGPGKGKRVVLISGDEEYRSEEALPQLGKILSLQHGFHCTVLFPVNPQDGTIDPNRNDNIPGMEQLASADLVIIATRFRKLPDEQMKHFADYLASGRPIIGLRTATHAFDLPDSSTYGRFGWKSKQWDGGFGRQVLGETWISHHGAHGKQSTLGLIAPNMQSHPILRGIKDGDIWGPSDVYGVRLPLPADSTPLVMGQVLEGMQPTDKPLDGAKNEPMMPIAWTKTYKIGDGPQGKVFTTTMGASQDLSNEGLRRLLVNATYWAVGLEDRIPEKSKADLVGEYKPLPFKFGGFEKNRRPADHELNTVALTTQAQALSAEAPVVPPREGKRETIELFNGKDLKGWIGHEKYWSVDNGEVVGKNSDPIAVSTYLLTERNYSDFRLTFDFKLAQSEMHSGIALWGRLAPEQKDPYTYAGHLVMFPSNYGFFDLYGRRGIHNNAEIAKPVGKQHDWNRMEILAQGNRIRYVLNGKLISDWREPLPERIKDAPIGLQLHSNKEPQEVRFKSLKLETFPEDKLVTLAAAAGANKEASMYRLYIGTYTGPKSKGIYQLEMDATTGKLGAVELAGETPSPSFLAIHPSGRLLYAANEIGNYQGEKAGSVSAFAIESGDGRLKHLNTQSSKGAAPCHVTLDTAGKNLLVANYTGGSVGVYPIETNGKLAPLSSFVQHTGMGATPRQKEPHAHSINLDAANRYAFVADLGLDQVLVYKFDGAAGKLTPNDPPFAKLAAANGPRHFAFHPSGKFAYVINEIASTMTAFRYDAATGKLTEEQTLSTLPAGSDAKNSTAEVVAHPSGKFLYGSNRGHNSIAVFQVDAATGRLTAAGHQGEGIKTPRNFTIEPNGRFLLVANQAGDSLLVFRIDPATGALTSTGSRAEVPSPVCIRMLKL